MRSSRTLPTALALFFSVLNASAEPDEWSAAEKAILRVPESAFPQLPERVRHVMRESRCLIPQPGDKVAAREPLGNVISGQFEELGSGLTIDLFHGIHVDSPDGTQAQG